MSNPGKDQRSQSPAIQASRPASAIPEPVAPPGQMPTIGAVTRVAQPPAAPAKASAAAELHHRTLFGDIVWYWEGVNVGEGQLRPINAIINDDGREGRWTLSLIRVGNSSLGQRTSVRQSDKPENGCWTVRDPAFLTGSDRAFHNPHLEVLERIKAEKAQRKAKEAALAAN